jgi:hypothetical protein
MTKFTLLGMAAILSTMMTTPVLAQAVVQRPGAHAFSYPKENPETESSLSQRPETAVIDRGTANAMASAPSARSLPRGFEMTTRPWSAPIGHHQPQAADVPSSTSVSEQDLDREDANVARMIRSICRGC